MRYLALVLASLIISGCSSLKPDLIGLQKQADTSYANGDYQSAAHSYAQLAKAMPTDAGVRYQMANSLARQGQSQEAIAAYRETLVRDPQHARAWHNLLQIQLREARATAEELLLTLNAQQPHAPLARARAEGVLLLQQSAQAAEATPTSEAAAAVAQEP